jgi:hypothetical protein
MDGDASSEHPSRMSSRNGHGAPERTVSTAHGATASCIARVVVDCFDACEEAGLPLSELQKVTLIETALLEFDGFGTHLGSLVALGELLRDLDDA